MSGDIAIAHDQITTMGGAERVAVELARTFDAPIYAMAVDGRIIPDDVEIKNVSSKLGTLAMRSHYLVQDAYQMLAWQHVPGLYEHDIIIQNKTDPMWFVPKDDQTIVRYLHSTPRGLYDQFHRRGDSLLSRVVKMPQRALFNPNVGQCDAWACNSDVVARRADLYWGIENVNVIYPPVSVDEFSRGDAPTDDYYVVVSRLHGHKRVADAVEAANAAGLRLKVAGDGPQHDHLESLAGDTVDILGYVDEHEKRQLLSGAKAFLMPAENEDFGMTPIEAMAAGTPVIGVREGFTRHQIQDGQNGLLYDGGARGLETALYRFEETGVTWDGDRIEAFADRFGKERFREAMQALVADAVESSGITVPWDSHRERVPARGDRRE